MYETARPAARAKAKRVGLNVVLQAEVTVAILASQPSHASADWDRNGNVFLQLIDVIWFYGEWSERSGLSVPDRIRSCPDVVTAFRSHACRPVPSVGRRVRSQGRVNQSRENYDVYSDDEGVAGARPDGGCRFEQCVLCAFDQRQSAVQPLLRPDLARAVRLGRHGVHDAQVPAEAGRRQGDGR